MSFSSGLHDAACSARAEACARRHFEAIGQPELFARRRAEIAALPVVRWKGRKLRPLTCHGDFGRGPHVVNVPLYVLWGLISLDHFVCPYHR